MINQLQTKFPEPISRSRRIAVWRDRQGMLHRAVGSEVLPRIRLLWTACGKRDIPGNAAWLQNPGDKIDCPDCASVSECNDCGALVDGDGYSIDEHCCFFCKAD